jgi:hypothetical protein
MAGTSSKELTSESTSAIGIEAITRKGAVGSSGARKVNRSEAARAERPRFAELKRTFRTALSRICGI